MPPKTGEYRDLFRRGLDLLAQSPDITDYDRESIKYYRALLDDPACKFGRVLLSECRDGIPGEEFIRAFELYLKS